MYPVAGQARRPITINPTAPRGPPVTSRIGYYSDDDEDPDELRERAFTLWRKHGARCNTRTLRLAHEYADDLGFYADGRAIHSALESRDRS
jgi:hypothetical protein